MLVVSAVASPEWSRRESLVADLKFRACFDAPQGRLVLGLIPFGVFLGIPAAMGLVEPSNVLALLGALVACMIAHGYLSASGSRSQFNPAQGWFVVLSWAILAFPLYVGSFSLADGLAVQAVLGPGPLSLGVASAALWVGLLAGVAAAAGWAESLPRFGDDQSPANAAVDVFCRWGETALGATAVASIIWGPSLGGLVLGPAGAVARSGLSFAVTCVLVAAASYGRRFVPKIPAYAGAGTVGVLTAGAMLMAAFAR